MPSESVVWTALQNIHMLHVDMASEFDEIPIYCFHTIAVELVVPVQHTMEFSKLTYDLI